MLTNESVKGHIEFKNVNFTYPTRTDLQVLKDFTLTIEGGKTTALVGPSGSGKSTVIQLIERFYDPASGTVTLDGKDITSVNLCSMRQQIGYVSQEPILFNCSIRENMKFAKPDATDEEIIQALKDANAWDFINDTMSEGINTGVGSGGGQLSGGQKQRIAIARAFLKKPKILLLDEATSALDKINERAIQDSIDKYRKSRGDLTIVVIAHRLSTIQDADKIVVVKSGCLVEMGNHAEILSQHPDGVYAGFVAKQQSAEQQVEEETKVDGKKGDDQAAVKTEEDPEEAEMRKKIDEIDEKCEEKVKADMEELGKIGGFTKLLPFNNPKVLIFTGVFGSIFAGSSMPIIGVVFSKLLAYSTAPDIYLDFMAAEEFKETGVLLSTKEFFIQAISYWSLVISLLGVAQFVMSTIQKLSFGNIGENATKLVRAGLYESIVRKNMGWFDDKENGVSVLTTAMSADSACINGVSTESLAPAFEGNLAMVGGIVIGLIFCWPMGIICIVLSPAMAIGGILEMEFQKAAGTKGNEL